MANYINNIYRTKTTPTYPLVSAIGRICPKSHSYDSTVANRTSKNPTGCPYCSGNKISEENNLQAVLN